MGGAIDGDRDDIYDGDMTPLPILSYIAQDSWNSESIEVRFSGDHERLSWTAGYYWFEEDASSYQSLSNYGLQPHGHEPRSRHLRSRQQRGHRAHDSKATGLFGQISFDITEKLGLTLGYRSTEDIKGAGALILGDPQVAAEFGTNPLVISADPVTNDANIFADNGMDIGRLPARDRLCMERRSLHVPVLEHSL